MKKTMVIILTLLITVFVAGLSIGSIITQDQLDSRTDPQIRGDLNLSIASVQIVDGLVIFNVELVRYEPQGRDYKLTPRISPIVFSIESINDCILRESKSVCMVDFVKFTTIRNAKKLRENHFQEVKEFQTQSDLFDLNDLTGLISDEDLKD